MKKIAFLLACCAAIACGDDDRDDTTVPIEDGGQRDMTPPLTDVGPRPDMPGVDMSMPGVDMSMPNGICPTGACNLISSEGCGAGEGCYYGTNGPVCTTAGTGGDDADCSGSSDCQDAHTCVSGKCRPVCCNIDSNDECMNEDTGRVCVGLVPMGAEPAMPPFGACIVPDSCDVLAQTGCEGTDACALGEGDAVFCQPPGAGIAGEDCSAGCAARHVCTGAVCAALCDRTADPGECPDGFECRGLVGVPDPVGACFEAGS